jgi:hypothetical protein
MKGATSDAPQAGNRYFRIAVAKIATRSSRERKVLSRINEAHFLNATDG